MKLTIKNTLLIFILALFAITKVNADTLEKFFTPSNPSAIAQSDSSVKITYLNNKKEAIK